MTHLLFITALLAGCGCGSKKSQTTSPEDASNSAPSNPRVTRSLSANDAAAPAAVPVESESLVVANTTRLVLVSQSKVNAKFLAEMTSDLRLGNELDDSPPTEREAAYLASLRSGATDRGPLPAAWQRYERVLLVSYSELSTGRKQRPRTVSVLQFTALLMPPGREPVYMEHAHNGMDTEWAASISLQSLGALVQAMKPANKKEGN